jgi:hypothetical protein
LTAVQRFPKVLDPIEAKKAASEAGKARKTFGQCAGALMAAKGRAWRSERHRTQWRWTLETYANPLWGKPVDEVDTVVILAVLQPLWQRIPETAKSAARTDRGRA